MTPRLNLMGLVLSLGGTTGLLHAQEPGTLDADFQDGGTLLLFITLDSLALDFTVRDAWVSLYEVLTLTAVGGYFTLRRLVDKQPRK